ncbi:MAG: hypothetical protein ACNA7W_22135, partial [Pseudomonadales bacterium]
LLIVANSGDRWYRDEVAARQAAHPNLKLAYMDGPHHVHLEPDHFRAVAALAREFLGLQSSAAATE